MKIVKENIHIPKMICDLFCHIPIDRIYVKCVLIKINKLYTVPPYTSM